jgi:elongation factor P
VGIGQALGHLGFPAGEIGEDRLGATASPGVATTRGTSSQGPLLVKVIASSLRKGNVVELDGKLYVVLSAENFHPGKGTPTTSVDMRRISDGVKVAERWRTTEMVERATVDERAYDFLYEDGEGFHFMEPETFEQVTVSPDVVGEQKVFLTDGIKVFLKTFEGVAISIELPQKVTVEITETEPVVKGQTASSSYKPAICSNGIRVMVPPHIGAGTRIVINTEDYSYVERAKD